ncbi:MAG TPA: sigma-70 family RNA polymerase sigma factor [Acetobacteraceae bacterium]|nr:sigma-70 family RNA polymerase sigma factor [Acetobacteraceae bacterium]
MNAAAPPTNGAASNGHASPRAELLAALPRLRAFAMSLCGHSDQADDLVQEALVKAWAHLASFEPGTNMAAWLYTILRNEFYTRFRKRRYEVADPEGQLAARLATAPAQESHIQFQDFRVALYKLAPEQREALMLVGASGLSYEEAAEICKCAVGTMKSRVNRARNKLATMLSMEDADRFAGDQRWSAAVEAPRVDPSALM